MWQKVGKIEIDREMFYTMKLETYNKLKEDLIIIDAESDIYTDRIIYTALSENFRETEQGEIIPFYEIDVKEEVNDEGELVDVEINFKEGNYV